MPGLGNARVAIQVDVGFGDVITPGAQDIVYPTLLGLDAPQLLGYTPETAIAEKLEAMVVLDMANTRMKDFLDIWILARGRDFAGEILAQAIGATFHRRGTAVPESTPLALTPTFHSAATKQTRWRAYLGLFHVVRCEKNGAAAALEGFDHLPDLQPRLRIQPRGGFVQKQHIGVAHQRAGQRHALPLAPR